MIKKFIINIVKVIGLGTLLEYVWEIVYDELLKLVESSESDWDNKTLEMFDKIFHTVIEELNV